MPMVCGGQSSPAHGGQPLPAHRRPRGIRRFELDARRPGRTGDQGLVGAMVVYPRNALVREDRGSRASATVRGRELPVRGMRDFTVVLQNQTQLYYAGTNNPVPMIGGEGRFSADASEDSGQKSINYRVEPAWFRLGFPPHLPFGLMARSFQQASLFANQQVGERSADSGLKSQGRDAHAVSLHGSRRHLALRDPCDPRPPAAT